jgi:hypothetical protein
MSQPELKGVGGWLAWMVFGMCVLGPLVSLEVIGELANLEFLHPRLVSVKGWQEYKSLIILIQVISAIVLFGGGGALWKRHQLDSVYIAIASLWLANLGAALARYAALTNMIPQFKLESGALTQSIVKCVLVAGVWTLYLLFSRRVSNTYANGATLISWPISRFKNTQRVTAMPAQHSQHTDKLAHTGFFRLGVVLTCIWVISVGAVVLLQYYSTNPFCQFDATTTWQPTCQSFFWSWVPAGKLAELSPHILRMVFVGGLPPVIGWLLWFATGWVISGFRASAT